MGLETVKDEIIRNANEQAKALVAEARSKASKIVKEAEKKIEELKEKSDAEVKKRTDIIKMQELASAELENKKMLLEAKKQLIDEVFAEVQKKVEKLDNKKRKEYIEKLLERAKKDIEVKYVYCNKKDLKLLQDFNPEAMDITGGLIAENEDKTVRVDYSFNTTLDSIKEKELQSINKILFG